MILETTNPLHILCRGFFSLRACLESFFQGSALLRFRLVLIWLEWIGQVRISLVLVEIDLNRVEIDLNRSELNILPSHPFSQPLYSLINPIMYFARNPLGYKNLLTWKQAVDIYRRTMNITKTFHPIRDSRLIDQMVSSGRSGVRNIEEGFKRATTGEYIKFLGFSIASLAELREDYAECGFQKKISSELAEEMERLHRGEDVMLGRQIRALEEKMMRENGPSWRDVRMIEQKQTQSAEDWYETMLVERGLVREESGKVRDAEAGEKAGTVASWKGRRGVARG